MRLIIRKSMIERANTIMTLRHVGLLAPMADALNSWVRVTICGTSTFSFSLFKDFIYFKERERESTCSLGLGEQRERGRESQADSPLSLELDAGLHPVNLRSWPEPKSKVGPLTYWATQRLSFSLFHTAITCFIFCYHCICLWQFWLTREGKVNLLVLSLKQEQIYLLSESLRGFLQVENLNSI